MECKVKTVLATGLYGRGTGAVGKGFFFFFLSWSDMGNWIACFLLYPQPYFRIPELCLSQLLCCTYTRLPSALQGHCCSLVIFWNVWSPCRKILAPLPHVANLFSKITKQFILPSHQPLYHTQSTAAKERHSYLSPRTRRCSPHHPQAAAL